MEYNFQVGDSFDTLTKNRTISKIENGKIYVKGPNNYWRIEDVKELLKKGKFKNYKPVTPKYEVGVCFKVNNSDIESSFKISKIHDDGTFDLISLNDCNVYERHGNSKLFYGFIKDKTWIIIPSPTKKQWKKEDFYNTKIIVDTPEKSERFQELINSLGISFLNDNIPKYTDKKYLYIEEDYDLLYGLSDTSYKNYKNKEIFYEDIFREEKQLNNNSKTINKNGNEENNSIESSRPSNTNEGRKRSDFDVSTLGRRGSGLTTSNSRRRTRDLKIGKNGRKCSERFRTSTRRSSRVA